MKKPENTDNLDQKEEKVESEESNNEGTKSNPETNKKDAPAKRKSPNLKKVPIGPGNFWNNMLSTVLLLILVMFVFSYITDNQTAPEELTITDVVEQVKAGEVDAIVVRGSTLEISYTDETRNSGETRREVGAPISESLVNLGVTPEEMAAITIDYQNETGFLFWLGQFAPFLFPLILLGVIIWFFIPPHAPHHFDTIYISSTKFS